MKELILNLLKSHPSPREAQVLCRKLSKRNIGLFYLQEFIEFQPLLEPWILLESISSFKSTNCKFLPFHIGILVKEKGQYQFSREFISTILLHGNYIPVFDSTILDLNSTTYIKESSDMVSTKISQLLLESNVNLDRFIITNNKGGNSQKLINLKELESPQSLSRELGIMSNVLSVSKNTLGMIMSVKDLKNFDSTLLSEKFKDSDYPISLVRLGFNLKVENSLENVDLSRLYSLLSKSFGKNIQSTFEERLKDKMDSIIIAGDYLGVIIVTKEQGLAYLDKFSVDPDTQGMGVSDLLWKKLVCIYPNLFWRSRIDNPVNKW